MDRHRFGEQLRVGHHHKVAGVSLQQRHPQPYIGHRARTDPLQGDPIADPEVTLEEDVVARHVVLEHVLHPEAGDESGEHDAEKRHIRALNREGDRESRAQADQPDRDHAADDHHHLGSDLAAAQELGRTASEEARQNHENDEHEGADQEIQQRGGVGRRPGHGRQRRQRHRFFSAASSAAGASPSPAASPSAATSPSAGTTASAAGISSSTLSSRLCTILTTSSSASTSTVTPLGTLMSATRTSESISSSGVRSTSKASGMSVGRHSTRKAWIGWRMSASPRLTAADSPLRWTGTSTVIFSSRLTA